METTRMFCRQCQETAHNTACTLAGVCGKRPDTAGLMDRLIAACEQVAADCPCTLDNGRLVTEALFLTLTNTNFDDGALADALRRVTSAQGHAPSHERPAAFDETDPDKRSLKEIVLYALKGIAAYVHHAAVLGHEDESVYAFVFRALREIGRERAVEDLTALVLETGQTAVRALALLDAANTSAYGNPAQTRVPLSVGTRPGILVSGHDLRDLEEILRQSESSGVDVYTHGEMLPAHYYPELRRFPHLRGNYGGAWHEQVRDFSAFNGAIVMTTNCIVPVADAYRDRLFTTGVAGYPGVPHIPSRAEGRPKDFSPVIARAKACPAPTPCEDGSLVGGFAHDQVLAIKDRLVAAFRAGKIRRFVVMAGCDGRHATRAVYTQRALDLPPDAVILTAGCAKYRLIRQVTGEIDGIPRVLDAGQCNDAYSLARIALALRDAFGLADVNELPLLLDLAWYEQKAVAVLVALLALGFRNIRLGPTLPAFLSPGVSRALTERFGLVCGCPAA